MKRCSTASPVLLKAGADPNQSLCRLFQLIHRYPFVIRVRLRDAARPKNDSWHFTAKGRRVRSERNADCLVVYAGLLCGRNELRCQILVVFVL